jgi:hypothetical protein
VAGGEDGGEIGAWLWSGVWVWSGVGLGSGVVRCRVARSRVFGVAVAVASGVEAAATAERRATPGCARAAATASTPVSATAPAATAARRRPARLSAASRALDRGSDLTDANVAPNPQGRLRERQSFGKGPAHVALRHALHWSTMRKTSVYLTDEQAERLARLARQEGRPQAEILRDAIARYQPAPAPGRELAIAAGFPRTDGDPRPISQIPQDELLEGFGA